MPEIRKGTNASDAVDVAIAFGEGRATKEELRKAAAAAAAAYSDAAVAAAAAYSADAAVADSKAENRLATANICRKYLTVGDYTRERNQQ